jgi:hypothetical protein
MKRAHVILPMLALLVMACGQNDSKAKDGEGPGEPGPGGYSPGPGGGNTEPDDDDGSVASKPGVTPIEGATEFISADSRAGVNGRSGGELAGGLDSAGSEDPSADDGGSREVERGDIFRVLGDGRILNLNAYRGLQVIDVRDVAAPKIEGRLDVTGTPVEMYVVGDRAIVLLNNWRGYYGNRDDVSVELEEGGLVAVVDISDRAHPVLVDDAHVPGNIQTSRLTQGGATAALYVAAQEYGQWNYQGQVSQERTILRSFDVTGSRVVAKSDIDLGGWVQDIQATSTDVLMVARQSWDGSGQQGSEVSLIDISSPDGEMVLGDSITATGIVQNKFNMDITGDILRVVSGSQWSGTQSNHLETFDISDLENAVPIDQCSFGAGEQLYATLFVDSRAFFVTYFRTDPFHAFSIDEAGNCEEHAEYIVSGWNDFFRATLGDTRLVGIGRNDEGNRNRLAVSLYDITDIDNPSPLIDRDEVNLEWGSSEAQWDDRAFTVLDDAVNVTAGNGTPETGLVLLPFEGWNEGTQEYVAQVQILTFSSTTLTRRSVMDHGSSVRRSFLTGDQTAANLSEEQLSLYDIGNPSAPRELGRLDVAPSFSKVLAYGDYVARVRDRNRYYYGNAAHSPKARVEIVERSAVLDEAPAVASFEVPSGAELIQVGDLLVSVYMEYIDSSSTVARYRTDLAVFDLSDPTSPDARGTLTTDKLQPSSGYYGDRYFLGDCFDCGWGGWGYGGNDTLVAGEALVFPTWHQQQETNGRLERCYDYPLDNGWCASNSDGTSTCPETYASGSINCERRLPDGEQWCTGELYTCDFETGECEVTPNIPTQHNCYEEDDTRYWSSMSFNVVDLHNPDAPALADEITAADDEEAVSVIASGAAVYFSYQKPADLPGDPRPYVRRYFRKLDVSNPSAPQLAAGINVPGEVIAVAGSSLFTRDVVWDELDAETMIARLVVDGGLAHLQAQRLFDERQVMAVHPDGAGHVLVSHGPVWSYYRGYDREPESYTLSILGSDALNVQGTAPVDSWATFVDAEAGKAIFSVSGGLLLFNVENAAAPFAQAYYPTDSWYTPELVLDDDEIVFAAGPYGIYRFDTDAFNLRTR